MAREHYIEKISERLNQLTKDELKDVSILTAAQLGVRQKVAEKESIENEIVNLKSQLEKQQLEIPEVPQFVADCLALIEANDYMISHEQAIEHKEAIVWLEEHQSELMLPKCLLYGYTVEKSKTIVSPCPVCGFEDVEENFCGICGHKNEYVDVAKEKRFYLKDNRELESVGNTCIGYVTLYLKNDGYLTTDKTRAGKFTQQEIDSMETGSYEQIGVEEEE